jgi:uncharacterized membrane protein (UPF0127 family)
VIPVPLCAKRAADLRADELTDRVVYTETHTEPSDAQKDAGNYKKAHVRWNALRLSIENPKGSTRRGVSKGGKPWQSILHAHYGYFLGTVGRDGDHVDFFLGDSPGSPFVYVVDQVDPETGAFDEHKVMIGFNTKADARAMYLKNYERGWKGLGEITSTNVSAFKAWLSGKDTRKPFAKREKVPSHAWSKAAQAQESAQAAARPAARFVPGTVQEQQARRARFLPVATAEFARLGIPAELAHMADVESRWDPRAVGGAGERNLYQQKPQFARGVDLSDTRQAAAQAAKTLQELHARYGSWEDAVAAYQMGPTGFDRHVAQTGSRETPYLAKQRSSIHASTGKYLRDLSVQAPSEQPRPGVPPVPAAMAQAAPVPPKPAAAEPVGDADTVMHAARRAADKQGSELAVPLPAYGLVRKAAQDLVIVITVPGADGESMAAEYKKDPDGPKPMVATAKDKDEVPLATVAPDVVADKEASATLDATALPARLLAPDGREKLSVVVDVADSLGARYTGMAKHASEPDSGMLFTRPGPLCMRGMKFALDAVFMAKDGEVLDVQRMAVGNPDRVYACADKRASLVLELPAKLGAPVAKGDRFAWAPRA